MKRNRLLLFSTVMLLPALLLFKLNSTANTLLMTSHSKAYHPKVAGKISIHNEGNVAIKIIQVNKLNFISSSFPKIRNVLIKPGNVFNAMYTATPATTSYFGVMASPVNAPYVAECSYKLQTLGNGDLQVSVPDSMPVRACSVNGKHQVTINKAYLDSHKSANVNFSMSFG